MSATFPVYLLEIHTYVRLMKSPIVSEQRKNLSFKWNESIANPIKKQKSNVFVIEQFI